MRSAYYLDAMAHLLCEILFCCSILNCKHSAKVRTVISYNNWSLFSSLSEFISRTATVAIDGVGNRPANVVAAVGSVACGWGSSIEDSGRRRGDSLGVDAVHAANLVSNSGEDG